MQETLKVLLAGIPSLLVAVAGLVGVLITQARADRREARIAADARESEDSTRAIDRQRDAAAEFMAIMLEIPWRTRHMPKGSFWLDAFDDPKELTRALGRIAVVFDAEILAAAEAIIDAVEAMVASPSKEGQKAIGDSEDAFLAALKRSLGDESAR